MPEPQLFVPFGDNRIFSLYKISLTDDSKELSWSIYTMSGVTPEIGEKMYDLQECFEQWHYKKETGRRFDGNNVSDKTPFSEITPTTPSIFLGLFLAAAEKMQQRKLKPSWASVTVTGDLDYEHNTGEMKLADVDDIDLKYKAVETYANEHEGKHLFIYINSEEKVREGTNGNVEVKRFSRGQSVFDIMDFVFEPYTPNTKIRNLDKTQKRLLNGVNNDYIVTAEYEKDRQKVFSKKWKGFFIHGEGASGKSVMAAALVRDMLRIGKIYAPLWINVINDEYEPPGIGEIIKDQSKDIGYPLNSIYRLLNISPGDKNTLMRLLAEKQYLIVLDNLELDIAGLTSLLNSISKLIDEFIELFGKNKPFLIITSRNFSDQLTLPYGLWLIEPPRLGLDHIESLIHNLAEQRGYLDKIKSKEGTEEYRLFLNEIFDRLGTVPGLISPVINRLRTNSIREVMSSIKHINAKDLLKKIITIYEPLFINLLPKKARVILFMMLDNTSPDELNTRERLFSGLFNKSAMKKHDIMSEDIKDSLEKLLDYNFIYRIEDSGESKYAIKTHCFLVFTFEPEFQGEFDQTEGIYLRDQIMTNNYKKLSLALRYDRGPKYVEPLLAALKNSKTFTGNDLPIGLTRYYLFIAAMHSTSTETLELITKYLKCEIDMQNEDGETAFLKAAGYNPNPEIMYWFLNNLDEEAIFHRDRKNGDNALCYAIFNTNPKITEILLKIGFDPNEPIEPIRLKDGQLVDTGSIFTPFRWALSYSSPAICECFLNDPRCDVNQVYCEDGGNNKKLLVLPITYAVENKNPEVLENVLTHGADPQIVKKYTGVPLLHITAKELYAKTESLDILKKYGCDVLEMDKNNCTALHHAVLWFGSIPVFNWLIKNGVDINAATKGGLTALHCAAFMNRSRTVFDWLVENGVDINAITKERLERIPNAEYYLFPTEKGMTAFHIAANYNGQTEVIEWFIERGVDLEITDEYGRTPLHYAASKNPYPEIYKCLVKHGANIYTRDKVGLTPLRYAGQYKKKDRVKWLSQYGRSLPEHTHMH